MLKRIACYLKIKISYFQDHMVYHGGMIWLAESSASFNKQKYVTEDLWCTSVNWKKKHQRDPYQLQGSHMGENIFNWSSIWTAFKVHVNQRAPDLHLDKNNVNTIISGFGRFKIHTSDKYWRYYKYKKCICSQKKLPCPILEKKPKSHIDYR